MYIKDWRNVAKFLKFTTKTSAYCLGRNNPVSTENNHKLLEMIEYSMYCVWFSSDLIYR